ncbi:hypothetical protein Q0590_32595 [Rhodocytophaga aerolata]|uniref:Uncharacterized protein n=1 Tax=Rhodocytophaga aerolata TaxID=455078 RepID=A0ABT8RI65_9BACT|nr:hypothetical protein [Rhodocytophaga aerolata]MDO1451059.1 hypothetical protein [Rhodocytophaga aerolata]
MKKITKEDILEAYALKKGKRNQLLFYYYKQEYFSEKLPADIIAKRISEDLGIPINRNMIYLIIKRYAKNQFFTLPSKVVTLPPTVDTFSGIQVIKEEKAEESKKVQAEQEDDDYKYIPKNTEDKPRVNPYAGLFSKNKENKE